MPSLSIPFQFGSVDVAVPGATAGGGAYYMRRKRWTLLAMIVVLILC